MAYRFPGMDPFLEAKNIWRGFHHSLAEEIRSALNQTMTDKYYADIELTTVYEAIQVGKTKTIVPDVGIIKPATPTPGGGAAVAESLTVETPIRRVAAVTPTKLRTVNIYLSDSEELVTTIEVLSPYNKREPGLADYRRKRAWIFGSNVHLVEIDLLRGGERVGAEVAGPPLDHADYILLVNRGRDVNPSLTSDIWPGFVDKPLPVIPIPLESPDPDVSLDLNIVLRSVYERAAYVRRIDYSKPAPPPQLRPPIETWMNEHLRQTPDE